MLGFSHLKTIFIFFFYSYLGSVSLSAQSSGNQIAESFSLPQVIELAQEQSPAALQNKTSKENRYWQYNSYLSNYRPQLVLRGKEEFSREVQQTQQNDGTYAFPEVNQNLGSLNLSLEQQIGLTGSTIFLRSSVQRFDNFDNGNILYSGNPAFIGITQPLFFFNTLKWDTRIEPLRYEESKRDFVEDMEQISVRVTDLFFDLLLSQASLDIAKNNFQNNETLYKLAEERPGVERKELLQLQVALLRAKQQVSRSELDLETNMLTLKSYIGLSYNDALTLLPPESIPDFEVNLETALEEANKNRQAIISFERQKLEADRRVAWAKGSTGLNANLNATFGLTNRGEALKDLYSRPQDQQAIVLNFSFPVMDWGRQESRVKTAEANQKLTEYTVAQQKINFEQEIITHVRRFGMLRQQVGLAEKNDEIAMIRYGDSQESYLNREISITDLNIAMQEKDEARRNYIAALRDFWKSYYQLRRLTLYDFENGMSIKLE